MIARFFKVLISLIIVAACFSAGFNAGLFLFLKETPLDASAISAIEKIATSTPVVAEKENYCDPSTEFFEESYKNLCSEKSKIGGEKGLEINLTANTAVLYKSGRITAIYPLAYQSQEGKWFQAPTGFYFAGQKEKKHFSSIFPVTMPFAFQYYQDFFIHGIPYYENGELVSSNFTGGCLRFAKGVDEKIFDFINTGDPLLVFKTFDDLKLKEDFSDPVDLKNAWIRQRFNNPYRSAWNFSGTEYLKFDYDQHAGIDFALRPDSEDKSIYSIADGEIAFVQTISDSDHGFGNTIIIKHEISSTDSTSSPQASSGQVIYSLYAHLSSLGGNIQKGVIIKKGEKIGEMGNSGYGCENYWKKGKDGCPSTSSGQASSINSGQAEGAPDTHLHFEIKKAPVLTNPKGGDVCQTKDNLPAPCYGYTPDYPQEYGYYDPIAFLFDKK